jgi:hypothetical protein
VETSSPIHAGELGGIAETAAEFIGPGDLCPFSTHGDNGNQMISVAYGRDATAGTFTVRLPWHVGHTTRLPPTTSGRFAR